MQKAGTGKTFMCLHEAAAIASGYDFLNYKNVKKKKTPVLYVEEMIEASIKNRLFAIQDAYEMNRERIDLNMFFLQR